MLLVAATLIFIIGTSSSLPAKLDDFSTKNSLDATYRLPNNTYPLRYDVELTTNLHLEDENPEKFKFTGKVDLKIHVIETSDFITLHAKKLDIKSVKVLNAVNRDFELIGGLEFDDIREFVTVKVKGYFYKKEEITVKIEYSGSLRDDNRGFYKSSYEDSEGNKKYAASTQFSAADARHAFPSYDEPQIRAIYSITIVAHQRFEPISNTVVKTKVPRENGIVATTFEDTPLMQTYILAFIVSEFAFIEDTTGDITHRVYGRPEAIENNQGDYALETGMNILKYQQTYFNLKYELPKMYQVALPDFVFGAMENWGLITYRETALLYDPNMPSLIAKRDIAQGMSHEFAHQFFGNLVSIKYWYYVWLKEGFSTLCEYEFLANLYPEYEARDTMVISAVQYALLRDGTEETRAMTTFVKEPSEIYFSSATFVYYQKGGSILRMFQMALTERTFKRGVIRYLEENMHGATDTIDLARHLENAARQDNAIPRNVYFKDIIDSWSLKSGYPVVHASFDNNNQIRLEQTRFSYDSIFNSSDLWYIPITVATQSTPYFDKTKPLEWFNTKTISIGQTADLTWFSDDWILVNLQEMGYFRVNYDEILWVRLAKKLKSDNFDEIHRLNRAQLVDDSLNIARTDLLSYYVALQVTEYLAHETEFVPWMSADTGFSYMYRLLGDSDIHEMFKDYLSDLVSPLYTALGIEDMGMEEKLSEKTKRPIAIKWACLTGDDSCKTLTETAVQEALEDPEKEPSADIRNSIYCNGLRHADSVLTKSVWDRMQAAKDQSYRRSLIQSLGCNEKGEIQKEFLESTLNKNANYREQEKMFVPNSVLSNGGKTGVHSVMEFVKENYENIEKTFVGAQEPVKTIVQSVAEYITAISMKEYVELLEDMQTHEIITNDDKERFKRTAQVNLDWLEKNEEDIRQFLKDYNIRKSTNLIK